MVCIRRKTSHTDTAYICYSVFKVLLAFSRRCIDLNFFRSIHLVPNPGSPSGDEGTRTPGFLLAKEALSRLSYIPKVKVGLSGLEPETSPLSEARSNQLS
jgi:hypothetical protein